MVSRGVVLACALLGLPVSPYSAAPVTVFKDVKTAFTKSAADRQLVEKDADLILDDDARTFVVKSADHPLHIKYDDILKVVFDTSTRERGGKMGKFVVGGLAGAAISAHHVTESWCFLEYREPDGSAHPYMLLLSTESAPAIQEKIRSLFSDRIIAVPVAQAVEIEKKTLKDIDSKHDLDVDTRNHPVPELMTDKALLVVVCPKIPSEDSNQMKIHANDKVVLVNRSGTYGFFYLEPGAYQIASQAGNAVALQMNLEAGKDYYLLQETFMGATKSATGLSQHSKELVMYLLGASNHADWKRK